MGSALSISNTVSKEIDEEKTSPVNGLTEEDSISNESIKKGDTVIGTYEVVSDPVLGGMGSVWQVRHRAWNIDLAMKRPQAKYFAEGGRKKKELFVLECENWINLGLHPNIVSCYYVREIGGVPTIFSEWMDGGSLRDSIKDGTLYTGSERYIQERLLDIAIQSAQGLLFSHENGLIHQDFKPGNLLLTRNWEAKVADFGLAKARSGLSYNSKEVETSGYTVEYCPKEQTDQKAPEKWMDVYSWAVTVLEMYAGVRLWKTGAEVKEQFEKYISQCRYTLPDGLGDILKKCLTEKTGDFGKICQQLYSVYTEYTGENYVRLSYKASDNSESLNNRALSFVDLGKAHEAEKIWKSMPGNVCAICNYTIYQYMNGSIGLESCIEKLEKLYAENPELTDIQSIVNDLKKRTKVPEFKTYSIGCDLRDVSRLYLHSDGRLAVIQYETEKQTVLMDIQSNSVIRKLDHCMLSSNQLQIDLFGKYILLSHKGTGFSSDHDKTQIYHVKEEDMIFDREHEQCKDYNDETGQWEINGVVKHEPYLDNISNFGAFADDRLITFKRSSLSTGPQTYDVYDYTARLNEDRDILRDEVRIYTEDRHKTNYYISAHPSDYDYYFSRFGKRFMALDTNTYEKRSRFCLFDTVSGKLLLEQNFHSLDSRHAIIVVDDEDRFMLCIDGGLMTWYDLAHNGRNSFVWKIESADMLRGAFVNMMPDGSRAVLLYGKTEADFVQVPVPEDNFFPKYLITKVKTTKETIKLEEQNNDVADKIKNLLSDSKVDEALMEWLVAQELELFSDNREYDQIEDMIDWVCRRQKMISRTKIGEYECENGEEPSYVWRRRDVEELILSFWNSMEIGAVSNRARTYVSTDYGSILNPVKYTSRLIIRNSNGKIIESLNVSRFTDNRIKYINRADASADGNELAVEMVLENPHGRRGNQVCALIIIRVGQTAASVIGYFENCKQLREGVDGMLLTKEGLYFWNSRKKLFFISSNGYDKIKKIKTGEQLSDADVNCKRTERDRTNCYRSQYVRHKDTGTIVRYMRSFDYEAMSGIWDKETESIMQIFKAIYGKQQNKDIGYCHHKLCLLGYGDHSLKEIEDRLK